MKSHIVLLIVILSFQSTFAQSKKFYSKEEVLTQCKQSTETYIAQFFSKEQIEKYLKINTESSVISFSQPLNTILSDSISKDWVFRYKMQVDFKVGTYYDVLNIELNRNFEVIENMDERYGQQMNFTQLFLQSHANYLKLLAENQVLDPKKVHKFIREKHPEKEWSEPEITRRSFSPYSFCYQVMQNNCSLCEYIYVDLSDLKELGSSQSQMIAIPPK